MDLVPGRRRPRDQDGQGKSGLAAVLQRIPARRVSQNGRAGREGEANSLDLTMMTVQTDPYKYNVVGDATGVAEAAPRRRRRVRHRRQPARPQDMWQMVPPRIRPQLPRRVQSAQSSRR